MRNVEKEIQEKLLEIEEKAAVYHYYGTARSTYQGYLKDSRVKYKKYFYALRPLLACRYIEQYHRVPPVLFEELLKMEMPKELRRGIDELLEVKRVTDEGELKPHMPVIFEFIEKELEVQKQRADEMKDDRRREWDTLNEVFFTTVLAE